MGELWEDLQLVDRLSHLRFLKKKAKVSGGLAGFADAEVLKAIQRRKGGSAGDRSVKEAELEELLAAPEGFGDRGQVDPNFHARRLPQSAWRSPRSKLSGGVEGVIHLHRLREVLALIGFTRFEAVIRDIHGEYDTDVERAGIALDPSWFPAIENRDEGLFAYLRPEEVDRWLRRRPAQTRIDDLRNRHETGQQGRKHPWPFPGGPYILLHTLAHLLIQWLAMRCGYPASSIRERIYVEGQRYGLLLYTGSPDAEGTLGGLVQQARHFEDHLAYALRVGELCSNDPICAQHGAGTALEEGHLHGAACHACTLIAETTCEMRNDYLDRALVVPTLGSDGAAFFPSP